jgi:hypothetical protein
MRIKFRTHNSSDDYKHVDDFLTQHDQPGWKLDPTCLGVHA